MCRIDAFNMKYSFAFLGYGNVYSGELQLSISQLGSRLSL
jgi:hypothetical protein